ncbi:hypothetical protein ALC53_10426 [Atta colombica]|uniref:Uncharacterized protein n=1 Tax=Atta colombica TaxID=520822 RepID=A0A151I0G8_9HYME|nr:hypothetical protein ALC53_10426 [Atta colombica]
MEDQIAFSFVPERETVKGISRRSCLDGHARRNRIEPMGATRQRARSHSFPILTVKINGRRRRKLRSPWPFLSREPESAAETGLPRLRVLEKCLAQCTLQAAYWYLSAEAIALLENIFFSYMPSRGHQPPFHNPNNVRDTPTMMISSTPVREKVLGDDSTRPCQPFCHRNGMVQLGAVETRHNPHIVLHPTSYPLAKDKRKKKSRKTSGPYPSRGAAGPVQQLISKGKSYEAVCVSSWRVNPSGIKGQNRRNGGATLRPAVRHNGRHEKSSGSLSRGRERRDRKTATSESEDERMNEYQERERTDSLAYEESGVKEGMEKRNQVSIGLRLRRISPCLPWPRRHHSVQRQLQRQDELSHPFLTRDTSTLRGGSVFFRGLQSPRMRCPEGRLERGSRFEMRRRNRDQLPVTSFSYRGKLIYPDKHLPIFLSYGKASAVPLQTHVKEVSVLPHVRAPQEPYDIVSPSIMHSFCAREEKGESTWSHDRSVGERKVLPSLTSNNYFSQLPLCGNAWRLTIAFVVQQPTWTAAAKTGYYRGNGSSCKVSHEERPQSHACARVQNAHKKLMGAVPHCPTHREGDAKTGVKKRQEERMLDLHEKIDGLEEGDACSVCSWPCLSSMHFDKKFFWNKHIGIEHKEEIEFLKKKRF